MSKNKKKFLQDLQDYICADLKDVTKLYFIVARVSKNNQWNNRVKIGLSKDPEKRLSELQTGNPFQLDLWYSFNVKKENAFKLEKKLHQKFNWSRTKGEWFKIHKCILEWITEHKRNILRVENLLRKPNYILRKRIENK